MMMGESGFESSELSICINGSESILAFVQPFAASVEVEVEQTILRGDMILASTLS
jgi:hypothetical protein